MAKVRIIDVANHSGVSKSTVSQYLNGRFSHMGEATKERIKNAIEELDYVPNRFARCLKTNKTKTIGLIVRDVTGFHTGHSIRSIDDYCKSKGYNVIIYNTDFDPQSEVHALAALKEMSVDGIIISSSGKNLETLSKYTEQGIPVVQMQIEYDSYDKNIVVSDDFNAAFKATEYLISLGHKNIQFLTQEFEGIKSRKQRFEGYKQALEKNNIPFSSSNVQHWDRENRLHNDIIPLLKSDNPPTALFAQHLPITTDLLTCFEKNNISIPNDVSLISFDDMPFAEFFQVPITVVKQNPNLIGTEAAKLLLDIIDNEMNTEKRIVVPCSLIKRKSCRDIS